MSKGIFDPETPAYIKMERRCRHLENTIAKRNAELNEENRKLKKEVAILKIKLFEQDKIIETLRLQIEELRQMVFGKKRKDKDSNNDGAISSSHAHSERNERPSFSYRRPLPKESDITDTKRYSLSHCQQCNTPLKRKKTITRYEEDIMLSVIRSNPSKTIQKQFIETGWCPRCNKQCQAKPISSQSVTIGHNTKTFILYANYILRLSFQQIKDILHDLYQFNISDGEIAHILEEKAFMLQPAYENLKQRIRASPGVHLDETSWKEQGEAKYAWVMTPTTGEEAVFAVGKSRGKGNAEELLGNFDGVRISDCYAAYKNLKGAHQVCWAHLIRTAKDLATSDVLSKERKELCQSFYADLSHLYHEVQTMTAIPFTMPERIQQYARLHKKIERISAYTIDMPKKLTNLKSRLQQYSNQLLTCILTKDIPSDNNKAERKLRHLVIKRKTSFGTKTPKGSHIFEINASVLLSQWWSDRQQWFPKIHALLNTT